MSMRSCVDDALVEITTAAADVAAVDLARRYADEIDSGGDLSKYGPKLLSTLEALLMTPRARAAVMKGVKSHDNPSRSALDELRERRERRARQHGAEAVDSPAP